MSDQPTIGEMRKAAAVTDDQIEAAVKAYLKAPDTEAFEIADGLTLNLARAMSAHTPTRKALADKNATETFRRTMVRTAILLARPDGGASHPARS
ncbi:hypothetical protein [Methylobacterium gnaphalii]|uniref:Uncharacterized protein n=1 Tax=Methylobacterium gnaphalii TaxID=1010610 RepID=A0A512JMD9_9HYPH|nr:hypothetical protein [Methylobacterium gnaphalii]GEP11094.1 hypothetical protein MGN01_29390 [Methylobacterium gnaphalii]GJD67093.1 hypothetical protein MMMDOFMJ_0006 [Methylobacterium gnaphalii]GLS50372.1 hypothetical protein GCM10007885_32240 [Methylobacterium gnaphalii]